MADQGITFDSTPVRQDTPAMTFDAAPVRQDTPIGGTATPQQQTQPHQPSTWERIKDSASEIFNPWDERNLNPKEVDARSVALGAPFDPRTQRLRDPGEHSSVVRGGEKALTSTLGTVSGWMGGPTATDMETTPQGAGEWAGAISENLMEFIAGDEALKGLSLADRLGLATKIAKLAESHPAMAKIIGIGLNATRTATVSGAQAAAHGGSAGDVVTAAGVGFGSSAVSEGLSQLPKLAQAGEKTIAGETLQTPPKWKGAATAANIAEANQKPAQRVIGNVARDSADAILSKFGKQAPDTIASFSDAAQAVEGAAKPVFKQLDTISNGEFQVARNEMDKAAKVMRRAASMQDLNDAETAYNSASGKIDQIFIDAKGSVLPNDLQNAKGAWRSMKVLEKLHTKIDAAYTMPQSAADLAGTDRTLQLNKLQGRLNAAFNRIPKQDLESVLGQQGTRNLYDLAALGADPVKAPTFMEVLRQIGDKLGSATAGAGAGALIGHALPGGTVGLAVHFLYTHPGAGALVAKGLSAGTSPKVIVPAVMRMIQQEHESPE
jgi:hypothetical protein